MGVNDRTKSISIMQSVTALNHISTISTMLTSVLVKPPTCGESRYTARNSRNLDVVHNKAMMNIGTNPDTGEFANDSIGHWRTT